MKTFITVVLILLCASAIFDVFFKTHDYLVVYSYNDSQGRAVSSSVKMTVKRITKTNVFDIQKSIQVSGNGKDFYPVLITNIIKLDDE